jgi:hypothetical protein
MTPCGPGSLVGMVTGYGLDGPGIEFRWGRDCKYLSFMTPCGPSSVVGMETGYGLHGPGIESRWGRDFPHLSRPVLEPNQPSVQWVPGLFRGKEWPERDADP